MHSNTVGCIISKAVIHTYSANNIGVFALSYSRVNMGFTPAELRPETGLNSCCL